MIPTIRFSHGEYNSQSIQQKSIDEAAALFRLSGCLILDSVFSTDLIETLHSSYTKRYRKYFQDKTHSDTRTVGDKRFMITVDIRPPFNSPFLYGNPFVLPIIKTLLGDACILGSFGSVVSLPGSKTQHAHQDHAPLFRHALDKMVPSYGITMIVPLVELNEVNGTTRVWQGSHVKIDKDVESITPSDPHVPLGSCLLTDLRLKHQGTANRSEQVRPLLYNLYHRPWFRDTQHYEKQPPILLSRQEYEQIPESCRSLFAWLEKNESGKIY